MFRHFGQIKCDTNLLEMNKQLSDLSKTHNEVDLNSAWESQRKNWKNLFLFSKLNKLDLASVEKT